MPASPIPPETHCSVEQFFSVVEKRLLMYQDAIGGSRHSLGPNMRLAVHHNMERLKQYNRQYNLFGRGPWGYGINQI